MTQARPSGRWYAAAALAALAGIVAIAWGVSGLFGFQRGVADFARIDVPGQAEVALQPGRYVVYYESPGGGRMPALEVLSEPLGDVAPIELARPNGSMTYEIGGYRGESVWEFTVEQAGTHHIEVLSRTEYGQLAIGTSMVGGLLGIVAGVLGGIAGIFLAVVLVVVTMIRRSRGRRVARPHPYGYSTSY